eukprot:GHVN01095339.1.p1 GENE.GHVN01095339.1~~GHVN01095339.1.p1  ORF type:complete len:526 (-),score=112.11 GHVN01095339.1:346-1923(-)
MPSPTPKYTMNRPPQTSLPARGGGYRYTPVTPGVGKYGAEPLLTRSSQPQPQSPHTLSTRITQGATTIGQNPTGNTNKPPVHANYVPVPKPQYPQNFTSPNNRRNQRDITFSSHPPHSSQPHTPDPPYLSRAPKSGYSPPPAALHNDNFAHNHAPHSPHNHNHHNHHHQHHLHNDLEAGHTHNHSPHHGPHSHQHQHHHHGVNTAQRKAEQQVEQCRVYCLQFFILYLYLVYMIVLVGPALYPPTCWGWTVCAVFNVSFVLMITAFWQCATMDPGEVPQQSHKGQGKFCMKCHNSKPDRTHHCSTCGKCVLNMDHHCPWLANCVGFHNRQFFIQILIYGVVCTGFTTIHSIVYMITTAPYIWPKSADLSEVGDKAPGMLGFFSVVVLLFFSLVLFVALITFARFHLNLVCRNATTIETTFNKANQEDYDLGTCLLNWKQVFGESWWWWWVPVWKQPLGDGFLWGTTLLKAIEREEKQQLVMGVNEVRTQTVQGGVKQGEVRQGKGGVQLSQSPQGARKGEDHRYR